MQHGGWDHTLKVTADGAALVRHAGASCIAKTADQTGLIAGLGAAQRKGGQVARFRPGRRLVSVAAAIALGAVSMSDTAVLAHFARYCGRAEQADGAAALDLAGTAARLERIARDRAKAPRTCRS